MTLDATVYCNCWESGRIRKQFSRPELVYVEYDGSLGYHSQTGGNLDAEFDQWRIQEACEHEFGQLVHCFIGNIAHVDRLREALECASADFPILLKKVLYNGIHCADILQHDDIVALQAEAELLSSVSYRTDETTANIEALRQQMLELCRTALSIDKPISF